jgi:hypothetical protein
MAERGVEEDVVRKTADSLAAAGVLRSREGREAASVGADSLSGRS